ncbi:alpha-galactosidase [Microbacterium hydrocarbonoxydans]|uniref:alpha-galactosidase n=1 Tax=Microbacterium hydrocarbonoxydans TaxID=273678 RepID=UPI00203AD556|nr:alpha-galactosidase [Microbacterium hydrocarbonoxydans]MCM3779225.1 alpha-galactosidase [Microbacterium hydrocarbonoxydans]
MTSRADAVVALRAAGASLVIQIAAPIPRILHWGADLGEVHPATASALELTAGPAQLNNSPDTPRTFSALPTEFEGWSGTPAIAGNAQGRATTPRPHLVAHDIEASDPTGGGRIALEFEDAVTGLRTTLRYHLDEHGVLAVDTTIVRDVGLSPRVADAAYTLDGVLALLPLPERAAEILDFSGKWCRERSPQRTPFAFGTHLRSAHRGKPGHDSPFLLAAGTPGFGFRHGEAWAVHLAWSGEQRYLAERLTEGAGAFSSVIGAGEELHSGEVILADGDRYDAPTALFLWSDAGLDGLADRLHRRLRSRASHPRSPRPLVLNTWEAVYFDHDLDRLTALVERAAEVGVERIVLDDGWFRGRREADAGLGDWYVDEGVWPDGLSPLVDLVRSHGMQFGLWFEPEMINLDSDLARSHPDWVLGPAEGLGPASRSQYVLDIARPEAYEYLLERIDALVREHGIDYLKWDHNRDLLEAVSRSDDGDRPSVRRQTVALYRLLDELRRRHPTLEIETCSGGGGRIDLGILERTDRVWASDCNDPVERGRIERWTRLVVPPELLGSHLGAARSHTTARTTDLAFRLTTALTAHAGIEQDLTSVDAAELAVITRWAELYREFRPLLHTGRVVNADLTDDATALTGFVAQDGETALYTWSRFATSSAGQAGRVRLPGLDRDAHYTVRIREDLGAASRHQGDDPAWAAEAVAHPVRLPGSVLAVVGIPLPTLNPQQSMLIDIRRIDD